ncbi:MAG: ion transporter [Candidatus Melainabacteria bacterium HGW-Melainabacteria-1]|nr:MAG: ion transporter [Candidatus Melainabacteria bacterium HGW-Melainabacteria-1]
MPELNRPEISGWRQAWYQVIFESDTPAGRAFDIALLWTILLSVLVVMLESVESLSAQYGPWLRWLEWTFTLLFSVEYLARVYAVRKRWRYIKSFFGIVDLLALIPTYLSLVLAGSQYLLVIRILRLLRVFRVLKLSRYVGEAQFLMTALRASKPKITVFLLAVFTLIMIMGTLMYLVEGPASGFSSIPRSMYWAVVTLTTVGYGDIAPQTVLGQALASVIMIMGYGILAVPTGIVTVELVQLQQQGRPQTEPCQVCSWPTREPAANFCKHCGADFNQSV